MTGLHVTPTDDAAWVAALREAREREWSTEAIQCHATTFGVDVFLTKMDAVIAEVMGKQ